MNADYQPSHNRSSFFSREPRFSLWIVVISLVVLLVVIFVSDLGQENPFTDLFCQQSVQKLKNFELSQFSSIVEQLTSVLEQIPK
ncbi:MAG: hypothetical protein ACFB15_05255 [Cyclobacteriaceae bacterium]